MIGGFRKLVNPPSFVSEVDLDATREARAKVHEEVEMRNYIEQLIANSAPGTGAVTIKPMEIDFVEVDSFEDEEEYDSDDPGPGGGVNRLVQLLIIGVVVTAVIRVGAELLWPAMPVMVVLLVMAVVVRLLVGGPRLRWPRDKW